MLRLWLALACADDSAAPPDAREDAADPDSAAGGDTGTPDESTWTVLLFLNGDNDLERWALGDVNEMEAVGSSDRVNVVVQLDRSAAQAGGDGDWSGARRYLVTADDDPRRIGSPVLAELGEVDSGSVDGVLDFVEWGLATFPADRVALVLWDHGDGWSFAPKEPDEGWQKGISDDYSSGSMLSVAAGDLTEVAAGAAAALGRPLDLFGFDACTMQQWEVATSVAPHAAFMVASQDYEGTDGWPYDTVLTELAEDPDVDGAGLGELIARRFYDSGDTTQSVLALTELPALSAALDDVADAVMASGVAAELVSAAAADAQGYDGDHSREHDLVNLLERMGGLTEDEEVDAALAGAITAAERVIVANYNQAGRVKNSHGLSIFSPWPAGMPPLYAQASWASAHRWDDLIAAAAAP
ncbi:MAG: hypothetical protein EXR71_19660 [Myxococcales bacterium]|nr:hypothetical protein [Myxococcales bacterium]